MVVLEGLLAAIGVSIGTAQLGGDRDDSGSGQSDERPGPIEQITLSSCGAVVIATNIAPTAEVSEIASSLSAAKLIGLLIFSLTMAAIICFYSDFSGPSRGEPPSTARSLMETALTYSVALAVSAALLWFFGGFSGQGLLSCLSRTIVLSAGASLGAAAGGKLLQQS
jgi:putative integral membrane protein (TIGR02587 family)